MIAFLMLMLFVILLFVLLAEINREFAATLLVTTASAILKSLKFLAKTLLWVVILLSAVYFAAGMIEFPPLVGLITFAAFCIWCFKALRKTYN